MTSVFRVIRLVPNAVAEEFINVGVVAYSPDDLKARVCISVLVDYKRVTAFSSASMACMVKTFLDELVTEVPSGEEIERASQRFADTIQFSDARASVLEPDVLLKSVNPMFLGANYA